MNDFDPPMDLSDDDVADHLNRIFENGPPVDPPVRWDTLPWNILEGDCLDLLKIVPSGSARLGFADPPNNFGIDYGAGHNDKLSPSKYLDWCRKWMEAVPRILTDDGSFWVLISDEWAAEFAITLREIGLHRRAWIKWYESFGVNNTKNFSRSSRHLFHMVKDPKRFVFNREPVTRPSARQTIYNDKDLISVG
jgi:site-specific DNA-methyltransferase (adenine-specific)